MAPSSIALVDDNAAGEEAADDNAAGEEATDDNAAAAAEADGGDGGHVCRLRLPPVQK